MALLAQILRNVGYQILLKATLPEVCGIKPGISIYKQAIHIDAGILEYATKLLENFPNLIQIVVFSADGFTTTDNHALVVHQIQRICRFGFLPPPDSLRHCRRCLAYRLATVQLH